MNRLRRYVPFAYMAVLAAIQIYLCRGLFHAEFTGHTNSIQGLWISMARLAREHWFRPAWWPFQDAGVPFEHTYMPMIPGLAALVSHLAGITPQRALFTEMAVFFALGPVTLFVLIWRLTRGASAAFAASLIYSLTAPSRQLITEVNADPTRYWSNLRFYGMVVWDDLPHYTAVCFLPLAVLFLWRSLEHRRPAYYFLAVIFIALTVLPSVFGATALIFAAVCMLAVFPRQDLWRNAMLIAALALAAYLLICPFLPPSLIATIRSNQQQDVEDKWSFGSVIALAMVAAASMLLSRVMTWRKAGRPARFFALFALLASSIPLLDTYLNRHFIPQPGRYTAEMDFGLALVSCFLIAWVYRTLPRRIAVSVTLFLVCVAGEHLVLFERFTELNTRPTDMRPSIEYRVAHWMDDHYAGQRVMVPGSIAQWFNVFSNTPQLSGASFSTTPNWIQQDAMREVIVSSNAQDTPVAVLWLKAFGVQAATIPGRQSSEFWKGISSTKFDGQLPVLWRQEDTTIYGVPQRSPSLAHVIPVAAVATRTTPQLPVSELRKYVEALDDPALPLVAMKWDGFRHIALDTAMSKGQLVSVQTSYHRGWHASANGRSAEVRRDGLGFLLIAPECDGPCHIDLTYNGGWEYIGCRLLSLLAMIGVVWYGWRVARQDFRSLRSQTK